MDNAITGFVAWAAQIASMSYTARFIYLLA